LLGCCHLPGAVVVVMVAALSFIAWGHHCIVPTLLLTHPFHCWPPFIIESLHTFATPYHPASSHLQQWLQVWVIPSHCCHCLYCTLLGSVDDSEIGLGVGAGSIVFEVGRGQSVTWQASRWPLVYVPYGPPTVHSLLILVTTVIGDQE
jgi:hypothetical protein